PPRLMGEGFVVMQSNDVDIYYYMDEPGLVPEEMENREAEACNEDTKLQDLPPCWGLDIVCGKGTDFNYGPWADRQRDCLWKFFFPADFQPMKVTEIAKPGKPRQILAFELRMNIIADATIDLLFTKNRETNAVHINVGAGSYLEVNIPVTVGETGYSPTIKGQLLHVDTTSSMQYRTLLEAEMLAFHVNASYPRIWNMPQAWQCEIEVYKATYHFIYAQKNFFTDLIQDWASDSVPDVYSFVPYSWKFKVMFHQFEMIWAANQHNWIDCSTKQQENVSEMEESMLSVLRPSQKPEDRTASSPNLPNGFPLDPSELPPDRLHVELELSPDSQITLYGPMLKALLSIKENYFGEDDMYTDFEEAVSSPLMPLSTSSSSGWTTVGVEDRDKKDNENRSKQIHPLTLRPWEITVLINLYKVHGRLPVHCSSDGPECPTAYMERLCFEMKKGYKETMLQLVLSPVHIFMSDNYQRPATDGVLREGHISLSGLQLRAHAMFSVEGLPLGSDSLEYAWLIDVQAGALTAKVTVPQLASLLEWGETFVFHVASRKTNGTKRKEWDTQSLGADLEKKGQVLSLQVPLHSHSSTSSSDENSSSSAALPLLASEKDSPSPCTDEHIEHVEFTPGSKPLDVSGDSYHGVSFTSSFYRVLAEAPESTPVSPSSTQERSSLCSPLKHQASVSSTRLGSTKCLSAAVFGEKQLPPAGVQFNNDVTRSDENVLDSPRERRSFGYFPFTPSADSNSFHQYRFMDSSMSVADSEAYFSAPEEFEPIGIDECPGTYPRRNKKKKRAQKINYSRNSIYHSAEGPLTYVLNGKTNHEPRPLPISMHPSQASFVSALGVEEESAEHVYSVEMEKVPEVGQMTSQPHVMDCYQNYLSRYQVFNWSVKQPTNKRTSKSSLHRPLDLNMPTSEESSSSFDQLSIPTFTIVKHGLAANSLLDRGVQLMGSSLSTPYTPFEKKAMENTDNDAVTEDWTLDQPLSQTRTTAIVEVKGAVDVVLTPLVAEALDRYIEAMVHFASNRHPASILDDLHGKVLSEAYQISKSTVSDSQSDQSILRGVVEEGPNNTEHGRPSVSFEKYASATKMQPQSSGSLRSNVGIEKGKEIAAKLNIHRIHGQLRGLDTSDIGTCAITAIPFEKSKVLFSLEELDEFTLVDETDPQGGSDLTRTAASLEKWGWIMFECGIENVTVKGGRQSGAILYSAFGVMGKVDAPERNGLLKSNGSSGSQTGSGYSTDVSEDNLPQDVASPSLDVNGNSDSDEQDEGVESNDLKKDLTLLSPPPDSSSMKLMITEIWFGFAAPTNVRSSAQAFSRQLNLLSTATPAIGAWLVPIDQLKSSLNKLETEGTLRKKSIHIPLRSKYNRVSKQARCLQENPSCLLCNILHRYLQLADYSIIEEATMNDGLPAVVTLKKGLVALARQWMKFIVVTQGFKAIGLLRPTQLPKPQEQSQQAYETGQGLDNGGGLKSDTSADGAEFEFDAATVSEHTMLLEGTSAHPVPAGVTSGPASGSEIMRKLSKSHNHTESPLKIKGVHPYQSLSYTSGDTATDSPAHVSQTVLPVKDSPRKESLLSYLTGSNPSLHNLLEATPQRNTTGRKSSLLSRTAIT
ncbi:UNVERIFIED_CONTAM: hypothetical protein FKN15_029770, partial [Acipenser sinensis]